MEKDFVNYDIALEMKQLGFDEPCQLGWYLPHSEIEEVEDNEKYGFSRKKQGILDNIHKKLEEIQELIEELKL